MLAWYVPARRRSNRVLDVPIGGQGGVCHRQRSAALRPNIINVPRPGVHSIVPVRQRVLPRPQRCLPVDGPVCHVLLTVYVPHGTGGVHDARRLLTPTFVLLVL